MRFRYSFLIALGAILLVAPGLSAQTLTTSLSGANEVPPVETDATGSVSAILFEGTADVDTVVVGGSFSGLESDYNASIGSHLHGGAAGENGAVEYSLTPTLDADNRGGTFEPQDNRIAVRSTFADSLLAGLVYVNIHTVDNPSGEIRGQLRASTPIDEGDIVINEFLADPAADAPGDANGDGTRESSEDEFIELVNTTDQDIDLSGYVIEDGASQDNEDDPAFIRHFFPAGTIVPAGGAIVIFGGGTPTGDFGGAVVQTAQNPTTTFSPQIGLNNGGDTITLATSMITGGMGGTVVAEFEYTSGIDDESFARNPDLTGDFVAHSSIRSGVLFSPGVMNVDGMPFAGSVANEPDVFDAGLAIRVANPLQSSATVRYTVGAPGPARLEAFDLLGRRVALLVDGEVAGDVQTATFDTSGLATGTYVLRLTGEVGAITRTVTVVR